MASTTSGCHDFTVPAGITSMQGSAIGDAGGALSGVGGVGDEVSAYFAVTPGEVLDACVGLGGGEGYEYGGGASGISETSDFELPLVVAGGGGGDGGTATATPGSAGVPSGANGAAAGNAGGGGGGSQTAVGSAGSITGLGAAGTHGFEYTSAGPGVGGGGYYGGGGGASTTMTGAPGGGGSDYCDSGYVSDCQFDTGAGATTSSASVTFVWDALTFVAPGCSDWSVPVGVGGVNIEAVGAAGADTGGSSTAGAGDGISGSVFAVSPGETLDVCVDYGGGAGWSVGGGASGVSAASDFSAPLIVAGGGGGTGYGAHNAFSEGGGGSAGSPSGSTGQTGVVSGGGGGGSQNAGGLGGATGDQGAVGSAGAHTNSSGPGVGGNGATAVASGDLDSLGGGGGGGYYGGGGGGGTTLNNVETEGSAGGGGGSDYCAIAGCVVQAGAGKQTMAGSTPGDAQVQISYGALDQAITFVSSAPSSATVGGAYDVSATGGGSSSPVVLTIDSSSSSATCTISGSNVSFNGVGTCRVDANQAGTRGYDQAPQVDQSFTISSAPAPIVSGNGAGGSGSTGNVGGPGPANTEPTSLETLVAPFASILGALVNQHKHQIKLTFSATGSRTGYQCGLVVVATGKHRKTRAPVYGACSSPMTYRHLKAGSYIFYLRAVGPGGTQVPPASRRFTVK
jgi:hypothetical protein